MSVVNKTPDTWKEILITQQSQRGKVRKQVLSPKFPKLGLGVMYDTLSELRVILANQKPLRGPSKLI